jgi:hypothetical protein
MNVKVSNSTIKLRDSSTVLWPLAPTKVFPFHDARCQDALLYADPVLHALVACLSKFNISLPKFEDATIILV